MEKLVYEIRPFVFAAIAVTALARGDGSTLMISSALLLLLTALYVLFLRASYRGLIRIR